LILWERRPGAIIGYPTRSWKSVMHRYGQSHLLRLGRRSEAGRLYHVITRTADRRPVFSELPAARALIGALAEEQRRDRARTLAFVVMPDHLHWLLELRADSLPRVVGAVKSVSAHRLQEAIWQPGFFDRAIRRDEDVQNIARYVIANPVRAGLVDRIGDYPHWDAVWL
jgi:REP element-mobilizing transposase RayT